MSNRYRQSAIRHSRVARAAAVDRDLMRRHWLRLGLLAGSALAVMMFWAQAAQAQSTLDYLNQRLNGGQSGATGSGGTYIPNSTSSSPGFFTDDSDTGGGDTGGDDQAAADDDQGGDTMTDDQYTSSDAAIAHTLTMTDQALIDQSNEFIDTVNDFTERAGSMTPGACGTTQTEGCTYDVNTAEDAFAEGLTTNIYADGVTPEGSTAPPVVTTANQLEDPVVEVDDSVEVAAIQPEEVSGTGTFGPDGDPINIDDLLWEQLGLTEDGQFMDWNQYAEYKTYGFNMSGVEWYGENRFHVTDEFFARFTQDLGEMKYMSDYDRQLAQQDRLISYPEYLYLSGTMKYNMSGVRYFGDDLGLSIDAYTRYDPNDDYFHEPYYWNWDVYELPQDFFERQDRASGWEYRVGLYDDD